MNASIASRSSFLESWLKQSFFTWSLLPSSEARVSTQSLEGRGWDTHCPLQGIAVCWDPATVYWLSLSQFAVADSSPSSPIRPFELDDGSTLASTGAGCGGSGGRGEHAEPAECGEGARGLQGSRQEEAAEERLMQQVSSIADGNEASSVLAVMRKVCPSSRVRCIVRILRSAMGRGCVMRQE